MLLYIKCVIIYMRCFMRVGIIFAMKEELNEFIKYLKQENEYKIFDLDFYEGTIGSVKSL